MNRKNLRPGTVVYHSTFTSWGKGVVEQVVCADCLEALFERGRGSVWVIVQFEHRLPPGKARMSPRELRKTPNRKKIKSMVALYAMRGETAVDGGDRLILPERKASSDT